MICRPPEDETLVANDRLADAAMERMLKRIEERSTQFLAELENAPRHKECPACNGVQALSLEDSKERMTHVYHCATCSDRKNQREIGERIERAGIPDDVRHATLDNFKVDRSNVSPKYQSPKTFVSAARAFLAAEKRNAILAGTPGIGKGHLAAAVAIEFIRQGKRVAWIECSRLFKSYHKAYQTNSTDYIIDTLGEVDLLVLDEVCLRELPADGEEILFGVLDRRHKKALQTLLLANKTADEIKAWLGGRVSDRLRSGGLAFCYGEWDSMRGGEFDGSCPSDGFTPFDLEPEEEQPSCL